MPTADELAREARQTAERMKALDTQLEEEEKMLQRKLDDVKKQRDIINRST